MGQFWGHKGEGKKPSFRKDLQFLLIGPLWLLHFVYRRLGWGVTLRLMKNEELVNAQFLILH